MLRVGRQVVKLGDRRQADPSRVKNRGAGQAAGPLRGFRLRDHGRRASGLNRAGRTCVGALSRGRVAGRVSMSWRCVAGRLHASLPLPGLSSEVVVAQAHLDGAIDGNNGLGEFSWISGQACAMSQAVASAYVSANHVHVGIDSDALDCFGVAMSAQDRSGKPSRASGILVGRLCSRASRVRARLPCVATPCEGLTVLFTGTIRINELARFAGLVVPADNLGIRSGESGNASRCWRRLHGRPLHLDPPSRLAGLP